ncbi:MAG: hypothetical protein ILA24_07520 [Ruminococcus sp.]|nr:hypothetical protein [Ruminococcus sp.]
MRKLYNLVFNIRCLMFIIMSIINAIKKWHKRRKNTLMNAYPGYYLNVNCGINQPFDNNGLIIQQQQQDQQWAIQESMKATTPFEHGGYDMSWGNSFNEPSFFDCASSFDCFSSFDSFNSFDNFSGGGMGMF